jgi:adenine-specific DNA-methyltransferase
MPTLKWIGKDKVINYHNEVPFRLLKENKNLSVNSNDTENLLIKGDNLEALKALLPYYYNQVKVIYIDPPYNTGNENWAFNDNVNSPEIKKWLGKVVGSEAQDLSRHDKWLCMMMPRLKLLRALLCDDGVIFVSIDDNEVHYLRMLMDEVFHGNFVGKLIWRKKEGGGQTDAYFVTEHEYVLVYAKSPSFVWRDETAEIDREQYKREDERGNFRVIKLAKWGSGARKEDRPSMHFPIKAPDGSEVLPIAPDGREGRWRVGKPRMLKLIENDLVHWGKKDNRWEAYEKVYLQEGESKTIKARSILYDLARTGDATNMLTSIFGVKDVFENAKPVELVKFMISHTCDRDDIILDSFAGSGTTAHAVLDLNNEDGGNRKFILVEMENDIAETITAERLKRVIQGYCYKKSNGEEVKVEGLGGGFKFLELGNPLFDKHKRIIGEPSYEDLAGYIHFTETRCTIDWGKANRDDWYVGESGGIHYFMIYGEKNDLDEGFLEIAKRYQGKKVVYADAVMIDDDELERFDIVFKQIPYEIRTF